MSNIGYKKAKPKTKRRVIIAALSVALVLLLLLAGLWRISGYKRFFRDSVEKWSRYYSVDEYLIYGMIYYKISYASHHNICSDIPHDPYHRDRRYAAAPAR